MGRKATTIKVYEEAHTFLKKEIAKRVNVWEKKKEGPKPWIADIVAELIGGKK